VLAALRSRLPSLPPRAFAAAAFGLADSDDEAAVDLIGAGMRSIEADSADEEAVLLLLRAAARAGDAALYHQLTALQGVIPVTAESTRAARAFLVCPARGGTSRGL